jgi:ABC-type polysaccharide/polyol phosphate transport system ATPase subunit
MARIKLDGVTLDYPIFTPQARSLRTAVYSRLGGKVSSNDKTTIVRALDNVGFELNDGDRLGIIGHNGAGKTTLLRVISRIYEPQRGSVDIQGKLSCYTDLTLGMDLEADGWSNIIFRCIFMGLTFAEARSLAPSIAEFSELGEFLNMPIRTYSTGMFVRLAFSITTSIQPDITVMDELIGSGDASFMLKAEQRLKGLLGQSKILVLASHSLDLVKELCNIAVWMEHGRMKAIGKSADVVDQYIMSVGADNTATAQFAMS